MPTIIALCGVARAGKDSVGHVLVEHHGFTRLAFADRLKQLAVLAHPKLAEQVQGHGWEMAKRDPAVRSLLQHLGVAVRNVLGEDTWVNAVVRQMRSDGRYVITDVRFANEAEALRGAGAIVARVTRPGYGPLNDHVSETEMLAYPCDLAIGNDGSLDDLAKRVDGIAPFFVQEVG